MTAETRVVVGSGPNAVGVTHALLERGFHVTMLDVGRQLEPNIAAIVTRMAGQEPREWSADDKAVVQKMGFSATSALNPKRAFGSSYAYDLDPLLDAPRGVSLYGSRAYGGLSNVWGCALLRCAPQDLSPLPAEVVEGIGAAYARVEELVTQSIGVDIFTASESRPHLSISCEAEMLLKRHRCGDITGALDVYPTPLAIAADCKSCNGCMYGCVYGYTYTTRTTVENIFRRNPRFTYVANALVHRYEESPTGVTVFASDPQTGEHRAFPAKQVFLAAGMMGSLRIVWNSNDAVARTLEASDSSCFLLPGLRASLRPARHHHHHGQSHLSVDLRDPPFQEKPLHCQLYFNNPAVADGLMARYSALRAPFLQRLVKKANEYLVVAQGYLHSDFCHTLALTCGSDGRIHVSVRDNPQNTDFVSAALSTIARRLRHLGLVFLPRFADVTPYGGSKTAGALRHAVSSSPSTTDALGRPFRSRHVFIVDATVLASVPGRNHTLTTLANAFRIGQHAE